MPLYIESLSQNAKTTLLILEEMRVFGEMHNQRGEMTGVLDQITKRPLE